MAQTIKIKGVGRVLSNLKKATAKFEGNIAVNLKKAGLFTQRKSQQIVPRDKSILINTARTRNAGGRGFNADVVTSYRTDYAVFVHEDLDARHKAGTRAKYLESAVRENIEEIFRIIAKGM